VEFKVWQLRTVLVYSFKVILPGALILLSRGLGNGVRGVTR